MAQEKTASSADRRRPTRDMVVWLLGTPDKTEGSLNDPYELEELGVHFNEKWTYANPEDGQPARIVYWHRYDLTGSAARDDEGKWRVDDELQRRLGAADRELPQDRRSRHELGAGAAARQDRMYFSGGNANPPVRPSNQYRPVSDFKGKADLGGYVEPA